MRDRLISIAVAFILCSAPLALARDYKDHRGHNDPAFDEAVRTKQEMVVTANPLATAAGAKILKAGGTAVDAMIAVQTVLGLVEPQASGIGGGAFVVYYDAKRGKLTTIDAREKAPAAATEDRFRKMDETLLGFSDAWQSGLSVGVPGVPRMMEYMHERYGRLHWSRLFQPAISLARKGFEISGRTERQINQLLGFNESCDNRLFLRDEAAFAYFANPECTAKPEGTRLRNRDYARTLRRIARHGADAFYTGPIAEDIVAAVQGDRNPSGRDEMMTLQDLADYQVVERPPVCIWYRDEYEVCGMGPPSSGAIAVGQILGILENFDLSGLGPVDEETVHLFAQAGRLAFADRNLYVGDTDFVTVPVEGMLDKDYLAGRADLITDEDMGAAQPGSPLGDFDPASPQPASIEHGTSHVSIVDRWGNALSMTTTVESFFGNGVLVRGFLLNNQLTDFSFASTDSDGIPIANRVQPEKRPRSSMSPTIIFGVNGHDDNDEWDDGRWGHFGKWGHFGEWGRHGKRKDDGGDEGNHRRQLRYLTGSPGGSRIIGFTAQSIINMIDFGLNPQAAINVPHFGNRNTSSTELEVPVPGVTSDYYPNRDHVAGVLQKRGYTVVPLGGEGSGLSIIEVTDHGLLGGADKRRDGTVGGR